MAKIVIKITDVFTFILLTGVLFVNMVKFSGYLLGDGKKWIGVAVLAVGVGVFYFIGGSLFSLLKRLFSFVKKLSVPQMLVILAAFVLATKVTLVFLLDINVNNHNDMRHYMYFAKQIADTGAVTDETLYATMYPYTVNVSLFLAPWVKLFGDDPKAVTTLMSILFTLTSLLIFDIARGYIGKNKAFVAVMVYNILPIGLFQTQVVVHETILLFLYALSFWLFLKATGDKPYAAGKRLALLLLSSLTISVGANINAGGYVVMISFVIYAFVKMVQTKLTAKKWLNLLIIVVSLLLCLALVSGLCSAFVANRVIPGEKESAKVALAQQSRMPMGWITYLGTNYEKQGVWNQEDYNRYHAFLKCDTPQAARDYQQGLIQDRISRFTDNPALLPKHFYHKYLELWGVPFLGFVYGLGGSHINDILLYAGNRAIYKGILSLCYLSNILIYSIILFSYLRRKKKTETLTVTPELQFKLMLVGIVLSLLLFEMVNKYVSHLHILLMMLAFFRMDRFIGDKHGALKRLRK